MKENRKVLDWSSSGEDESNSKNSKSKDNI
jgi:hypothetical protein